MSTPTNEPQLNPTHHHQDQAARVIQSHFRLAANQLSLSLLHQTFKKVINLISTLLWSCILFRNYHRQYHQLSSDSQTLETNQPTNHNTGEREQRGLSISSSARWNEVLKVSSQSTDSLLSSSS